MLLDRNDYRHYYLKARYYNQKYFVDHSQESLQQVYVNADKCLICLNSIVDNYAIGKNVENGRWLFQVKDGIRYPSETDSPYYSIPMASHGRVVAIYFGAKCDDTRIKIGKKLLEGKSIKFYKMGFNLCDILGLKLVKHSFS